MPTAFETLAKILKLERERGYNNSAVIGGLAKFGAQWSAQAHAHARVPDQHLLAEELNDLLMAYDGLGTRDARQQSVGYMMDRLTGRIAAPETYRQRQAEIVAAYPPPAPREASPSSSGDRPVADRPLEERRRRDERPRREEQQPREGRDFREKRDEQSSRMRNGGNQSQPPRDRERRQSQAQGEGQQETQNAAPQVASNGNSEAVETVAPPPLQEVRSTEAPPREQRREQPAPKQNQQQQQQRPQGGKQNQKPQQLQGENGDRANEEYSNLEAEFRGTPRGDAKPDLPTPPRLARPPRTPRPQRPADEAADILRGLHSPVEVMKGIGPEKARLLNKLGIESINDLLNYLPRRYDDYTKLSFIRTLQANEQVTVIGMIRNVSTQAGRGKRSDFSMTVDDGSAVMSVKYFSQGYLINTLRPGMQVVLRGTTTLYRNRIEMINPEWEPLDVDDLKAAKIVPVYPLTEGVNSRQLRKLIGKAVEYWAEQMPDYVPEPVIERADLADIGWALTNLHEPETWDHLDHARRRYVFDQLLLIQLAILDNRRAWQSQPATSLPVADEVLSEFMSAVFPYELTGAQQRAIADIRADIATDVPMNRLLQGDVGSGKTAVAITALAIAYLNGKQGAIMAPTGILAEQHYRNLSKTFAAMPGEKKPTVALLTGSLTAAERERVYAGLADGSIDIIVGTHAIIQGGVEFKNLALAIIDEQHRFGVEQRGALRGKGTNPHLLVMTATPIPRTLSLTIYADLDLSIMDEMPPGRTPVKTRVIEPTQIERAYASTEGRLEAGEQAFIVFPLVEVSESIEAQAAVEQFENLKHVFYKWKVGLLHGRMKPAEKDAVMAAFREQQYDVLVTTSVAEVGVDIPNASVIIIHSADRFGLAQLHQFRGRVGRGGQPSYCLLVCNSQVPQARQRLTALEQTNDGFKLAEIDWQLRGPGDLVGTRQSGQPIFKLMEAVTPELVELAQREARTVYAEDQNLDLPQHRLLKQRVTMLRNERSDLS